MNKNIVDELKEESENSMNFYYDEESNANKIMRKSIECFLSDDKWRCEGISLYLMRKMLAPHAKGKTFGSNGDLMNLVEKYEEYSYGKQRIHLAHLVYVFLLGLWIYNNNSAVKNLINKNMKNTTTRFSGGTVEGEFLFRWRLAALAHDVGYIVSLSEYTEDNYDIEYNLKRSEVISKTEEFNDLFKLARGKEAFALVNGVDGKIDICEFYKLLKEEPLKDIYYDHGLMSALIILKKTDNIYKFHDSKSTTEKIRDANSSGISFCRRHFDTSIVHAAHAVAVHNLNWKHYGEIFDKVSDNKKIYDFKCHPFAALLKLCDELQEWNKPPAKDDMNKPNGEPNYTTADKVVIKLEENKIKIEKFPKMCELFCTLNEYFNYIDTSCDNDGIIISFPCNNDISEDS